MLKQNCSPSGRFDYLMELELEGPPSRVKSKPLATLGRIRTIKHCENLMENQAELQISTLDRHPIKQKQ